MPLAMGSDRLLHLHGLHDDDLVAFVDLFSLYDINLDDCSLHRAGHRVAGLLRRGDRRGCDG